MFDLSEFDCRAPEWAARLSYHSELGSTNDEALRLAKEGAAHGTVVLAESQTSGRGRRGTEWISKPGDGLWFSIVIRPDYLREYWSRLALATGLAVAACLRHEWQLPAEVKWPNDIYISGKKCCGVLVEAREDFAIVGVGINVAFSPADTESTSIWQELGQAVAREELLVDLLTSIERETLACGGKDFTELLIRLRKFCMLTGKEVTFISNGNQHQGTFMGIGSNGEMLVRERGEVSPFLQAEMVRLV
ncbi:MAG: biotin--[acetyl-CoA-carboxylase] ligase [Akkermansiaceae bacterium]